MAAATQRRLALFRSLSPKEVGMSKYLGLLSVACAAVALPLATAPANAGTTTPAQKYCLALSKEYGRYVAASPTSSSTHKNMVGDVAIAQCKEHNPGPAIPVLEHELVRSKLPLPPRPSASQQAEFDR
jgi:hypothetical protein